MINSKMRQSAYLLGTIATSVITLVAAWNGMSGEAANAMTSAVTALLGLLGVGATATATAVVSKQRKEGAFDPAASPADQAINGIQEAISQAQTAAADVERIKAAAAGAVSSAPSVGPLAQQVIDAVKG